MQLLEFISDLKKLKFENTFNPYVDCCNIHDTKKAPEIRTEILFHMLKTAKERKIKSLWLGRDLGHRGGRRTGLTLTDDIHFSTHMDRWKLINYKNLEIAKKIKFSERTATVIWQVLNQIQADIFL